MERWPVIECGDWSKNMKKQYPSDDRSALLEQSLKEAMAFETGRRDDLRVTKLPPRPKPLSKKEIAQIRHKLGASQAVFARILNVSVKTVRAWESGLRTPSDAALKLLVVAKNHPQVLFSDTAAI
jgi:putative transcriptional regulator